MSEHYEAIKVTREDGVTFVGRASAIERLGHDALTSIHADEIFQHVARVDHLFDASPRLIRRESCRLARAGR